VPYALYADKAGSSHDKTRSGTVSSVAGHVIGDTNYLTKFTGLNTIGKSLFFDNGSNVGLGTTSPLARLHLYYNTSAVLEHIRMHNPNSNGAGRFTMYNDGANSYSTFTKYGTNRSGGYAGIATLYPYANLLAFGNNGIASGDGLGRFLISSGGNIGISLFKSGSSKLKFHADFDSENVGIGGGSAPISRVHLNNTDGALMDLRLTNNTSGHTANDGLVISQNGNVATIMNKENSSLMLGTNNNNQITITNGGAVGVGTTTPTTKLDVNGQIRMQGGSPGAGKLMTSDANGVGSWSTAAGAGLVSGSGTINTVPKFTPNGNTLGNSMITDDGYNVGINNPSPLYKLDILYSGAYGMRVKSASGFATMDVDAKDGYAAVRFANDNITQWGFQNNGASNNFSLFEYGNGNALYVTKGTRNIGLGTNTPKNRLDISGSLAVGSTYAGTNIAPTNGALIQGNLGVGTTTPASKLHVNRNDGNYLVSLFENSSASNDRSAMVGIKSGAPASNNTWYYGVGGTGNGLGLTSNQFYIENLGKGARFSIDTLGRVKVGKNISAYSTFNIGGNNYYDTASITFNTKGEVFNISVNADGQMQFIPNSGGPTGTAAMTIDDDNGGRVVIGTVASMPSGYKLYVKDGILTERLKVAVNGSGNWADYVFAEDYNLLPLDHVEAFIKENKHLPNVPSAEAMAENGLDVATMDAKLMEKIEELTLYLIEMKKEIKALKAENELIKANLKK
ncbi:MAG: hypothetical protein LC096_04335, partial [Bacteroidia bacterium]|nr:hypothetical protein [Bacteroidia bacterium]